MDPDQRESDADCSKREGNRVAEQQKHYKRSEHRRRQQLVRSHFASSLPAVCVRSPVRNAMRLISSAIACSTSSAKPAGMSAFTYQRTSPPASLEISCVEYDWTNIGHEK